MYSKKASRKIEVAGIAEMPNVPFTEVESKGAENNAIGANDF